MSWEEMSFWAKIALILIISFALLIQSSCIFISARKRGHNAWLWGLIGLTNVPQGMILYALFLLYIKKRRKKERV
ncbi:transcriptional regulator [Bacillus sp. 1P06AnD]|uniref:transcriptional regulator n=1 Tax=Bacillus sp. 1P06AnD TaxID=3132208 RepID=UPI0039A0E3E5